MQLASEHTALYLYFDEAGDFNFKANGSKSFFMTGAVMRRRFETAEELLVEHYDLLEQGQVSGYFHASEDRPIVRERVLEIIARHAGEFRAYVYQARKDGLEPFLPARELYRDAFESILFQMASSGVFEDCNQVIAITDAIPLAARKDDIQSRLKGALRKYLPKGVRFRLIHQRSEGDFNLQVVDYLCWALFRKCERGDDRTYELLKDAWSNTSVRLCVVDMEKDDPPHLSPLSGSDPDVTGEDPTCGSYQRGGTFEHSIAGRGD